MAVLWGAPVTPSLVRCPAVSVTLDLQSASGYLQLSEDWKCVTYSSLYQTTYLHPQQFDCEPGGAGQ